MHIKVTNISDFLSFILNSFGNGEKSIRVFISEKETFWEVGESKQNIKTEFTFVLFTHLYQVIYNGSVKADEYSKILSSLKMYQDNFEKPFSITRFENIVFWDTTNQLLMENELGTI